MFYFLGIDIGGGDNTWAVALRESFGKTGFKLVAETLCKGEAPSPLSLESIKLFILQKRVLSVAIDAPLSFSLSIERGFRRADKALRDLLPSKAKAWVLSWHSLMGIPLKAYLFAKKISPYCGTLIETHPRANLYFLLPEIKRELAFKYKREGLTQEEVLWLRDFLYEFFSLSVPIPFLTKEDCLDALICALIAWTYQRAPEKLLFLPQEEGLDGFGPFVVFKEKARLI